MCFALRLAAQLAFGLIRLVNLRDAVKLRQLEVDAVHGTDLGADAALLAQHLKVSGLSIDKAHDLGRAACDAYAAAVTPERVDYWEHLAPLP